MVSGLSFKSLIHFELIVYGVRQWFSSFLPSCVRNCSLLFNFLDSLRRIGIKRSLNVS